MNLKKRFKQLSKFKRALLILLFVVIFVSFSFRFVVSKEDGDTKTNVVDFSIVKKIGLDVVFKNNSQNYNKK